MKQIILAAAFMLMSASASAQSDPALSAQANAAFLAQNAKSPGVTVLDDGLQYSVISEGTGARPDSTDTVRVLYKGTLINGKVFDQTQPDSPARFIVYQLIAGWTEALLRMRKGSHWRVVIPANLAYGDKGAGGGLVPPNQTLIFDMTLVSVFRGG